MAKSKFIARIKEGSSLWNSLRQVEYDEIPDLSDADLSNLNLEGFNFEDVNFRNAKLNHSSFKESILRNADFTGADLSRASLRNTDITNTKFCNAILSSADLRNIYNYFSSYGEIEYYGANFTGADLSNSDLTNTDLSHSNFSEANLTEARLFKADLRRSLFCKSIFKKTKSIEVNFTQSDLTEADCRDGDFVGSVFRNARLYRSNFENACLIETLFADADLTEANLTGVNLRNAIMVNTILDGSRIENAFIHGISVWDISSMGSVQNNLVITNSREATITVDNIDVAQFIYLILKRKNIRNVIDAMTSKAVLILGRFTPERKIILDGLAEELRQHNLLPIIFDFERSSSRDFTETIKILASMSLFVIADITNPKSAPLELQATVPDYEIPFITLLQDGEEAFSMFNDLSNKYDWVLKPVLKYPSIETLRNNFKKVIIDRMWEKHQQIQFEKGKKLEVQTIDEFINS